MGGNTWVGLQLTLRNIPVPPAPSYEALRTILRRLATSLKFHSVPEFLCASKSVSGCKVCHLFTVQPNADKVPFREGTRTQLLQRPLPLRALIFYQLVLGEEMYSMCAPRRRVNESKRRVSDSFYAVGALKIRAGWQTLWRVFSCRTLSNPLCKASHFHSST